MQSYPFTSQVTYDEQGLPLYDRAVDSAFLRQVFAAYFSDGIFYKPTNALQVVASTGMEVQINPGICHIQGAIGIEDSVRKLTISPAGSQPRITTIVARLDLSQDVRSIERYAKDGTPAATPTAPALTRDSTIWELGLADIKVGANVSTITQADITDTRLDDTRCGVVAQTIGELDTQPYFAQVQALIDELEAEIAGIEQGSEVMLKNVYVDGDDPQPVAKANSVPWSGVTGKPGTYPPSTHNHDDRYYTESEIDSKLSGKANTSGSYPSLSVGNATNANYANSAGSARANNITMSLSGTTLNISYS